MQNIDAVIDLDRLSIYNTNQCALPIQEKNKFRGQPHPLHGQQVLLEKQLQIYISFILFHSFIHLFIEIV